MIYSTSHIALMYFERKCQKLKSFILTIMIDYNVGEKRCTVSAKYFLPKTTYRQFLTCVFKFNKNHNQQINRTSPSLAEDKTQPKLPILSKVRNHRSRSHHKVKGHRRGGVCVLWMLLVFFYDDNDAAFWPLKNKIWKENNPICEQRQFLTVTKRKQCPKGC